MDIATDKPCLVSWLTIPVLMLLGTIDEYHYLYIQVQSTTYVLANFQVMLFSCLDLLIIGTDHWIIRRKGWIVNTTLLLIQHLITVFVLIVFILFRQILNDTMVNADSRSA